MMRFICLLTFCCLLSGCSADGETKYLVVSEGANFNSAVQLDLLTVGSGLAQTFVDMRAEDWFANKPAFIMQYSEVLAVKNLELVPLSFAENIKWGEVDGKNPQYFAFVNWRHQAELYQFGKQVPEYLFVDKTELKDEIPLSMLVGK